MKKHCVVESDSTDETIGVEPTPDGLPPDGVGGGWWWMLD